MEKQWKRKDNTEITQQRENVIQKVRLPYQENFHGSDYVHRGRHRGAEIEQQADGSSEFRSERTRNHEI